MADAIEFVVIGNPAPKGSKRHVGNGVMIEMSAKVKPWVEAVKWAAFQVFGPLYLSKDFKMTGPVTLDVTFTFERPKSKKKTELHCVSPDLDKLERATMDAITQAGLWEDDSRVTDIRSRKRYVGHPEAMELPGAKISIRRAA